MHYNSAGGFFSGFQLGSDWTGVLLNSRRRALTDCSAVMWQTNPNSTNHLWSLSPLSLQTLSAGSFLDGCRHNDSITLEASPAFIYGTIRLSSSSSSSSLTLFVATVFPNFIAIKKKNRNPDQDACGRRDWWCVLEFPAAAANPLAPHARALHRRRVLEAVRRAEWIMGGGVYLKKQQQKVVKQVGG